MDIKELLGFLECEKVEYKELGELELNKILNLGRGKIISQNDLKNCPGEYPVYSSSATKNGEIGKYGRYMFDDERITWSIDGGGKFFYRNNLKYSVTNVCGWIKVTNTNELNTKYLFYALINEWAKKKFDYTKKAHPSVIKKEYQIPIPPLEIQQKIVEILDAFTELQAELQAELHARRKQYEYYRNKLLSFEELEKRANAIGGGLKLVSLGEVCEIGTGKSNRSDCADDGEYPLYVRSAVPLRTNNYHFDEEAVVLPGEGGIGDIFHYVNGKYALHQRAYRIHPKTKYLNVKFMYFYLFANFKLYIRQVAVNATVMSIRLPMLENFQIPLPPLKVQNDIVEILDKFDALANDLSTGLPAEIDARQKQYEHYRAQLLHFKEKCE